MSDWGLSPLDISFLSIETPATPMTIGAVAIMEPDPGGDPDRSQLAATLAERAARIPRLRRRLQSEWFPPVAATWAEDPSFSAGRHVRLHRALLGGGAEELHAWIARTMARPLERAWPLWEIHILSGLTDGTAALLFKVHHALLDGLGLGAMAYAIADGGSPDLVPGPATADSGWRPRLGRRVAGPWRALADPAGLARATARTLSTASGVVSTIAQGGPGLPFDTTVSPARAFASASLSIADLRGLRPVGGGSVNDVGIAVLAGAMRTWLQVHHFDPDPLRIRALVPVSRERTGTDGSGNHFSAYVLDLPVHVADPVLRLQWVAEHMTDHRRAGPDGGAGALAGLTNLMPAAAVRLSGPMLANAATKLFSLLVTTVPVPRPLRIGECAVREIYPLPPLGPSQPLAIGCAGYRGRLYVGVTADPIVVPDIARLTAAIPAELAVLRTVAGLRAPAPTTSLSGHRRLQTRAG